MRRRPTGAGAPAAAGVWAVRPDGSHPQPLGAAIGSATAGNEAGAKNYSIVGTALAGRLVLPGIEIRQVPSSPRLPVTATPFPATLTPAAQAAPAVT